VLIICYGNPLRGDDGLGWHAAGMLREALPRADVMNVHQLTPELAEECSQAELAIFVDAAEAGVPGEWRYREVRAKDASGETFTHHVTPAGLLTAAGTLYGRAPRALLYTMTGESFEVSEGLSETIAAALPEMLAAVCRAAGRA